MKEIPMLDLYGGYKYMQKDIDLAIKQCLDHQKWILGPEVKMLEEKVAKYMGLKYCVGVSSGTDALVLALRAMAIIHYNLEYFNKDLEIITTPFTFTATGDAILRSGAKPVFVDVDVTTYNIDPGKIREYLANNDASNVVGIIPVHLYGLTCEMDEIMKIAKEYNLFVLEDAAQAFGGMWNGKKLGSIGIAGTYSFFPSKNLGGYGDGGMVGTNDADIEELVRMLVKHGGKDKYNVDHVGYNGRLDTLQAAILMAKLKHVDAFNYRRRQIAKMYTKNLEGVGDISLPTSNEVFMSQEFYHVYHQFTVSTSSREGLQEFLKQRGISTMVYYPFPLHRMKVFGQGRSKVAGSLEHTERLCNCVLSLPMEPLQSEEDTKYVVDCIEEYFNKSKVN